MNALLRLSRAVDRTTALIGRASSWLVLVVVLVSAGNAVVRKTFNISSNGWLEIQWYLFGAFFMLAAAWTLQKNEHIRVDIVSGMLSRRTRDWIDLLGHVLFLLPFTGLMIWLLVPYVRLSLRSGEYSPNAGGLIVWPAKALLLVGFVLLFAQGLSELVKRAAVMFYGHPDDTPLHHSHPTAEDMAAPSAPEPEAGR